jgi:hypothetical protein
MRKEVTQLVVSLDVGEIRQHDWNVAAVLPQ